MMTEKQGDPRFLALLDEVRELHVKKAADYGTDEDYLHNLRASEGWGVSAWLGTLIRLTDKVNRLQTYAKTGKLANEGVRDSLQDLAAYALLALVLFDETTEDTNEVTRHLAPGSDSITICTAGLGNCDCPICHTVQNGENTA